MNNGYIKLYRKIRTSAIFNDMQLYRLWTICLTEASHTEREQIIGKQTVKLNKGEFVTGRFDLMEMYNSGLKAKDKVKGEKTVFRWLETLEKGGYLTIKKTNKFSIVSIDNWGLYQGKQGDDDLVSDHQMTIKRPSNDHQMTTNKNEKNVKNEKNDTKKPSRHKYEPCDLENAKLLFKLMRENNPEVKEPNLDSWANEFRLMRERDKRSDGAITYLINWSQNDEFWKTNILSPAKLRKQYVQLTGKIKAAKEKRTGAATKRKVSLEELNLSDE
jgi:hypothetical protein